MSYRSKNKIETRGIRMTTEDTAWLPDASTRLPNDKAGLAIHASKELDSYNPQILCTLSCNNQNDKIIMSAVYFNSYPNHGERPRDIYIREYELTEQSAAERDFDIILKTLAEEEKVDTATVYDIAWKNRMVKM